MSDYNAEGAWQLVGLSTPDEQPDEVRSTIKTFGAAQHEAQLETVFGQAMVGIMQSDHRAGIVMANERFCEILGRSEAELLGCNFSHFTHPDDLAWNKPLFEQHARDGRSFQVEKRYTRPDREVVWCEVSVSFVRDSTGTPTSCIIVAQDISARKAAEAAAAEQATLLQNVIDSVADLIFVKDLSGTFVLANQALKEGCGDIVGLRAADFFPQELSSPYEDIDQEVISSRRIRDVEETIFIRGKPRQFQTVKVPWMRDCEIAGVIGVSRDITERKAAEAALRKSELLYRSVLEASADSIKIIDLDGRLQLMNSPGQRAVELENFDQLRGRYWISTWPQEHRRIAKSAFEKARRGKVTRFSAYRPTSRGTPKWWDVLLSPIHDEAGRVSSVLAIARDITEQRETAQQLQWTSEHDALTSLPNRRAFEAHLQAAILRAMESTSNVGLLLIDLDHFKHVNDTLGHAAGDKLLQAFGKRLKDSVRAKDFVARLGGDEFAVIMEAASDPQDLVRTGESVLRRLKQPLTFNGRVMSAGASIGGALFPRDAQTANELINNADTALYALKETGRGGTKMFHQYMRQEAQKVASQLSLARVAISQQTVEPHYQPKVKLSTGELVGFEALLRWRHPTAGLQLPETVSEAFKDYELAAKIGELMQRAVFADMRSWIGRKANFGLVSINAAPAEFLRDDFAERLIARMIAYEISPHLVEVEVTEHVFFDRSSAYVSRALKVLKEAGVRISLDDFGTGYSSLSHLRDFPVDVVKIDHSFVGRMATDPEIAAIVSAVVQLGASLQIEVVAEGIETEAQRSLLVTQGCPVGQGYLFGRASTGDEAVQMTEPR